VREDSFLVCKALIVCYNETLFRGISFFSTGFVPETLFFKKELSVYPCVGKITISTHVNILWILLKKKRKLFFYKML